MSDQPSAEKIARFMKAFDILGKFEAQHQLMRKWGAFDPDEWPDKPDRAVVEVATWLRTLASL